MRGKVDLCNLNLQDSHWSSPPPKCVAITERRRAQDLARATSCYFSENIQTGQREHFSSHHTLAERNIVVKYERWVQSSGKSRSENLIHPGSLFTIKYLMLTFERGCLRLIYGQKHNFAETECWHPFLPRMTQQKTKTTDDYSPKTLFRTVVLWRKFCFAAWKVKSVLCGLFRSCLLQEIRKEEH